jgi:hypothetical protein
VTTVSGDRPGVPAATSSSPARIRWWFTRTRRIRRSLARRPRLDDALLRPIRGGRVIREQLQALIDSSRLLTSVTLVTVSVIGTLANLTTIERGMPEVERGVIIDEDGRRVLLDDVTAEQLRERLSEPGVALSQKAL